jgi:hypothetical protein
MDSVFNYVEREGAKQGSNETSPLTNMYSIAHRIPYLEGVFSIFGGSKKIIMRAGSIFSLRPAVFRIIFFSPIFSSE